MACTSAYSPTFQPQNPAKSLDPYGWSNCAAYVGAMGADYATCGAKKPTGRQVRSLTNEPIPDPSSPGLSIFQVQEALDDLGVEVETFTRAPWTFVEDLIDGGHYVSLAIQYSVIRPTRFSGDPSFYNGHAIGVPPGWEAVDPLCDGRRAGIYRYQHETYPRSLLRSAAGAFRVVRRRPDGSTYTEALGLGWAQGWYTPAHPAAAGPLLPFPKETNMKLEATVYQRWTAQGTNGVLRRNPVRSEAIIARLPAGTVVTSRAEASTPDGNHWRLVDHPTGTRNPAWLLRYGPGVPKDHDFKAGPIVTDPIP
jgi:hypothetical protein